VAASFSPRQISKSQHPKKQFLSANQGRDNPCMLRKSLVVSVILLFAGCATGTPMTTDAIGSPGPDAARLVVYRPAALTGALFPTAISLNGVPACDLQNGSGFVKDISAGSVTLLAPMFSVPGTSRLTWTVDAGHTYYVRVAVSGGMAFASFTGGVIGMGIAEATSDHTGLFDVELTAEADALASGVKLTPCQR
jgi:hypothetical protein